MNLKKILFLLSILGVFLTIILTQTTNKFQTGIIESIQFSENKMTIHIENFEPELILFITNMVNIKKGDFIKFKGKQSVYENKDQVIVDKIFLLQDSNP